jgi:hypothetical protein
MLLYSILSLRSASDRMWRLDSAHLQCWLGIQVLVFLKYTAVTVCIFYRIIHIASLFTIIRWQPRHACRHQLERSIPGSMDRQVVNYATVLCITHCSRNFSLGIRDCNYVIALHLVSWSRGKNKLWSWPGQVFIAFDDCNERYYVVCWWYSISTLPSTEVFNVMARKRHLARNSMSSQDQITIGIINEALVKVCVPFHIMLVGNVGICRNVSRDDILNQRQTPAFM